MKTKKVASRRTTKKARKAPNTHASTTLANRVLALENMVDQLIRDRIERTAEPQAVIHRATLLPTAQDRYVKATSDGWLLVMMSGVATSLPSGLKVSLESSGSGRDNGVVLEGIYNGKAFDVKAGNLEGSFRRLDTLQANVKKRADGPVVIDGESYDLELRLTFKESGAAKSAGPYAAKTDPTNPLPAGDHDIEIADYPHKYGVQYGPHGTVWFRIGHSGDRYAHPGRVSAGCLTCAPPQWEEIYEILNSARLDKVSVGRLKVN